MHPPLNWKDILGVTIWATGFLTEVIADRQKNQWRKDKSEKKHDEDWISSGLWAKSRHPNYFGEYPLTDFAKTLASHRVCLMVGESTIWTGAFVASAHALNTTPLYPSWFGYLTIISPIFTYLILTRVRFLNHNSSW